MARIWMINQYASTPCTGMGGRHHYLACELARRGHDVTLIAASWHHLLRDDVDADMLPASEWVDNYRFVRVPVPRYSEAHARRRVWNWFQFALRIAGIHRRIEARPDTILYSSPSLVGYLGAERLARRVGARLVFEVRDIWPLTLVEVGGYSRRHPFIRFLQWVEDRAYSRADVCVSNLEGAVEHMASRGLDRRRFRWIPNGFSMVDIEATTRLPPTVIQKIPEGGFRIAYVGTLGVANALGNLIDAADLTKDLQDVYFVVVGHGRERERLEQQVARYGLRNVFFTGPVPKRQVQDLLCHVDACYIGLTPNKLFRFGVSPNKLLDYMIAAKPILYAIDSGGYGGVRAFGAGLQIPPNNPQALAVAIRKLRDMPEVERRRIGENGRRVALEHYDYAKLAIKLEQVLVPDQTG